MCLRQCTDLYRVVLVGLLAVFAGCAGSTDTRQADVAEAGGAAQMLIVPPEALTLYEQAVASMAGGDMADAESRFQDFLLKYPQFPGAYVNLAIILSERGDLEAAEANLQEALAIDPEQAVALNRLGMVLRRQGRLEDAERAYQGAIAAAPDYALAYYNLGVLYDLYFRRFTDALDYYERYQELAGEDPQVARWITDLERRQAAAQRTANVTE